jgi:hypothetical protein
MNFFDWVVNIGCISCLLLFAIRAAIACDQRRWGRFSFCVSFAVFVLRVLIARWTTGLTKSTGVRPDAEVAAFISSNEATIVIVALITFTLAWATIEEYFENRERRRLKRFAQQQVSSLEEKNQEIERLNQRAVLFDGASFVATTTRQVWTGQERRKFPRGFTNELPRHHV